MSDIRILVNPPDRPPYVVALPAGPEADDRDLAELLGLAGGESVVLLPRLPAAPSRTVTIGDLEETA
jgi:hypothetical protein